MDQPSASLPGSVIAPAPLPDTYTPYLGDAYRDFPWLLAWCEAAAKAFPDRLSLTHYGASREGRPLLLLTLHLGPGKPEDFPAFWLDGGTHASEWAGVMSTLFTLSRWLEGLAAGDPELIHYFTHHTAYIAPCFSPDGMQYLMEGGPYLRSTKRAPRPGERRGFDPADVDGDGEVLWMRWKHPAGMFVPDETLPMLMRPRRLTDSPEHAYFVCQEGNFLHYDEAGRVMAAAQFGLDLNRNFPVHWVPFAQFGMDGGEFALSEPESRAVVDAFHARPNVCAAVTNHTYTGGILTAPYRPDHGLTSWDLDTLGNLAREAVEGTGYRIFKVFPEFQYEAGKPTPGVWADYLTTNRGIPAYTLELWDPYGHCGTQDKDPARSFFRPDMDVIRIMVEKLSQYPNTWRPWKVFQHPQLGEVEIGGLIERLTVRNPPPAVLPEECARAFQVADRIRRAVPEIHLTLKTSAVPEASPASPITVLTVEVQNQGYLNTMGLSHAEKLGMVSQPVLKLTLGEGVRLIQGSPVHSLPHLTGWGDAQASFRPHPLNPVLPNVRGNVQASWTLAGRGEVTVAYVHERSGRMSRSLHIGEG